MACKSPAIAYPHPRHHRRSGFGRVRPARWPGPKIPHVFRTDVDAAHPQSAFAQVRGLRPKALVADSSTADWIPTLGIQGCP